MARRKNQYVQNETVCANCGYPVAECGCHAAWNAEIYDLDDDDLLDRPVLNFADPSFDARGQGKASSTPQPTRDTYADRLFERHLSTEGDDQEWDIDSRYDGYWVGPTVESVHLAGGLDQTGMRAGALTPEESELLAQLEHENQRRLGLVSNSDDEPLPAPDTLNQVVLHNLRERANSFQGPSGGGAAAEFIGSDDDPDVLDRPTLNYEEMYRLGY
jgi:hypothetical protein